MYSVTRLDLDEARTDPVEVPMQARSIALTRVDSPVSVRVGRKTAPAIYIDAPTVLELRDQCREPILELWIENEAGDAGDVLELVDSGELKVNRGDPHRLEVVAVPSDGDSGDPAPVALEADNIPRSIVRSGSVTATTTATALAAGECLEVAIKADGDNTEDVFVGDDTDQEFPIGPGEAITLPISELSDVYLRVASGTEDVYVLAYG